MCIFGASVVNKMDAKDVSPNSDGLSIFDQFVSDLRADLPPVPETPAKKSKKGPKRRKLSLITEKSVEPVCEKTNLTEIKVKNLLAVGESQIPAFSGCKIKTDW